MCSLFGDTGAARMFLDNRSRITLKRATINKTAGPMIKMQVTNTRIGGTLLNQHHHEINVHSELGACTRLI
jgi:hypothetical protein